MALINRPISSLFNGVSQQPASLRLSSQGEAQENAYSALVDGLKKRPPTEHIKKLRSTLNADAFVHWINRDTSNRYVVLVEDKSIEVYDLTGTAQTVVYNQDTFTSINNVAAVYTGAKRKYTLPTGVTTITLTTSGITTATVLWEQSATGVFGGEETTIRTDTTDTSGTVSWTSGYWIRARISAWTAGTILATVQGQDVTYLDVTTPRDDFAAITVADYTFIVNRNYTCAMHTETRAGAVTGSKQLFSDLPASPGAGDLYEVAGDPNTQLDSYYVEYDGTDAVWREVDRPGITYKFDPQSMPHVLVHDGASTFTFQEASWLERKVGDAASAPEPTFIGQTISGVFFHKNRLGLLTGENVVMSGAADFFNFWRGTATAVLDDDVIDIAATTNKVSTLRRAVPFDEAVVLFADQQQFTLTSGTILAPTTVAITPTTAFEADTKADPIAVGKNVYFPVIKENYSGVREYFVDEDSLSKDAADITAHVPRYIPKDIIIMDGSTLADVVLINSLSDRDAIYVYKYFWGGEGNKKLQSSWSQWTFADATILGYHFYNTILYMVVQYDDGVYLEQMRFESGASYETLGFQVHLDRRTNLTGSYDSGNNWTTWTLPYDLATDGTDGVVKVVLGDSWASREAELMVSTRPTTTTVRVAGEDLSANDVIVGVQYTMRYRFSEQFIKDDRTPPNSVAEGRLMMRRWLLKYTSSGQFRVEVTPKARDKQTYVMSGKLVGDVELKVGDVSISNGEFTFPVMAASNEVTIELINDTFLPSIIQSAEWQAQYSKLSRRGTSTS